MEQLKDLRGHIIDHGNYDHDNLTLKLKNNPQIKRTLEDLGALHIMEEGKIKLTKYSYPIITCLGLNNDLTQKEGLECSEDENAIDTISRFCGGIVKPRGPTRIGTRMGRPEKAKERMMKPPIHALYPIGNEGTNQRLVHKAAQSSDVNVEVGVRYCNTCEKKTHRIRCMCGTRTTDTGKIEKMVLNVALEVNHAKNVLGINQLGLFFINFFP